MICPSANLLNILARSYFTVLSKRMYEVPASLGASSAEDLADVAMVARSSTAAEATERH